MDNLYSCEASVIFFGHERNLTQVSNNHMIGRNNSDVHLLIIRDQLQLSVIPRNINQFFPNLEAIMINNTRINEFSRIELEGLANLKQFHFGDALVTKLGNDLFIENPLMDSIRFENNPIQHIAQQIFDHLRSLVRLTFINTTCVDDLVATNRTGVLNTMFQVIVNCPPTIAMVEEKIINGPGLAKRIEQQVDPLEQQLETLRNRVAVLERS